MKYFSRRRKREGIGSGLGTTKYLTSDSEEREGTQSTRTTECGRLRDTD